jgi:L-ascorbate metabolism protein UlaG (beta-lactamase superfamily)
MLRWQWRRLHGERQVDPEPHFRTPSRPNDGSLIKSLPSSLTWVGHASFVLKLDGRLFATDPVWSRRLSGVLARRVPPGVALDAIPPIDVVLVSHNHRDHFDLPSLKRIGPSALYVVPLGNAELLRKLGLTNVVELDWWQTHTLGQTQITLVPARHWSMRNPWDRNNMLWGGFVIRSSEGVVYHSGDTALFDGFSEIGKRCGPIDWALLPIGAYEPRWFMQPQHMNPDDAVQAFEHLGARTFVAMHWGTFKLTDEPLSEPPVRLRALWNSHGLDEKRLWVLDVGETRPLSTPMSDTEAKVGPDAKTENPA